MVEGQLDWLKRILVFVKEDFGIVWLKLYFLYNNYLFKVNL